MISTKLCDCGNAANIGPQPERQWVTIECGTGDQRAVHVCPDYGPAHALEANCWCAPKVELYPYGIVVIHGEAQ